MWERVCGATAPLCRKWWVGERPRGEGGACMAYFERGSQPLYRDGHVSGRVGVYVQARALERACACSCVHVPTRVCVSAQT